MCCKGLLAVAAALVVGFAGTYFVAGSGGGCDGGCPISKLLGMSSASGSANEPCTECLSPKSPCCSGVSKVSVAGSECCASGKCCKPGAECCPGPCCDTAGMTVSHPVGRSLPDSE